MKAFGRSLWRLGTKSRTGVQGRLARQIYWDNFYHHGIRTKLHLQLFQAFPTRHLVRFSILNAL